MTDQHNQHRRTFQPNDRVRHRRRNQPATVVKVLDDDYLGVLTDFHARQGSKLITLWHVNEVDRIDETAGDRAP